MKRVPFSFGRTRLIAGLTVREALRQRLVGVLVVAAVGLVAGVQVLRDFNFGTSELKFIADFGDGVIAGFGAALTIVLLAQLFFSEIENRTVLTLLAKPVWRAEFLLGKFLGVVVVAAVFCVLLTATLAVVLWGRESDLRSSLAAGARPADAFDYATLWVAAWLQWLKLSLLAAGTLLVASFAQTQLFAIMTGLAGFVICHLQGVAHSAYGRGGGSLMLVPATLIHWMFPDFQRFTLGLTDPWTGWGIARLTVYTLGYAVTMVGLAVYVFRRREI